MQNGTRKGGAIPVFESLRKSPGFEDVWQLHWSYNAGIEHNAPGVFIANVDDRADDCRRVDGAAGRRHVADAAAVHRRSARGPSTVPPGTGAARRGSQCRLEPRRWLRTPHPGRGNPRPFRRRLERRLPSGRRNRAPQGSRPGGPGATRWARRPWTWRRWRGSGGAYAGLLHQGLSAGRRHVHRHQHAERLQQDLPEARELDDSDTRLQHTGGARRRGPGALAERRRGESEGRSPSELT